MQFEPDILVKSLDGFPIAIVEVKNRQQFTPDVAIWIRQDYLTHGLSNSVRFFLLVSQDVGYLWDQMKDSAVDAPPTATFDMQGVTNRYDANLREDERIGSAQLEFVVFEWLRDLTERRSSPAREPESELDHSGFLAAIQGGRIMFGVTV